MKTILIILLLLCKLAYPIEFGTATYYTVKSNKGTRTASGIPLSDSKLTAAHRTLKFGTKVKVICLSSKKEVIVTITDRGPFTKGRVIDLSYAAAKKLGIERKGVTKVKLEKVT